MKNKPMLSGEALAALVKDDELETSAGEETAVKTEEEILAEAELAAAELAAKADEEAEANEESTESLEDKFTSLSEEFNSLTEEFVTFKKEAEAKAVEATEAAEAKVEEVKESFAGVKDIVIAQIAMMRIKLNIAAVDMKDWDVDAVQAEYEDKLKAFMKAMPVGSVVPEKEEETKAAQSSHDVSAVKSLGFN